MSRTTLSEPAYHHLLQLILTRQLPPGIHIPESQIAEDLHISRTPVRDALRRLNSDGLVDLYPNRFAQVRVYTDKEISDIGTLRIALDTMAIKLACLYGCRADFIHLLALADAYSAALEKNDLLARSEADCNFHLELTRIACNEQLLKFQRELILRIRFIIVNQPETSADEMDHARQHYEIAEALMAHDEEKATAAALEHLTSFYDLRNQHPAHFFDLPFLLDLKMQ